MELFVITMVARNGKTLYLYTDDGEKFSWTFDMNIAYADDCYSSIEKFAKNYFKHFKDWNIEERYFTI